MAARKKNKRRLAPERYVVCLCLKPDPDLTPYDVLQLMFLVMVTQRRTITVSELKTLVNELSPAAAGQLEIVGL